MSILALETWLKSDRKYAFYYYEVGQDTMMFQPTDFVDITAQAARKRELVTRTRRKLPTSGIRCKRSSRIFGARRADTNPRKVLCGIG